MELGLNTQSEPDAEKKREEELGGKKIRDKPWERSLGGMRGKREILQGGSLEKAERAKGKERELLKRISKEGKRKRNSSDAR